VALLLGGDACLPRPRRPDLSADPAALLAQVRAGQDAVQRVQGEARARVKSPQGGGSARQFLAAEKPDRLRLEVLDFFGNPALLLVTGGGRFSLYDARQKVLYRGPATPENLARLVPLPLPAEDLVTLVCGGAPLLPGRPVEVAPEGARVVLTVQGDGVVQRLALGDAAAVQRAERRVAGGAGPGSYEVTLSDRSRHGALWFPGALELRSDPARVQFSLQWTEVEVNGALDPGLFKLDPPRGARVVEVGRGDPPPAIAPVPGAEDAG
jgi:outer membrane biogenesis lipoprotein LolB